MILIKKFGQILKEEREKYNISQRELGRRIGKTGQYISYLESNTEANPSLDVVFTLSDVLGISVDALLGIEGDWYESSRYSYEDTQKIINEYEKERFEGLGIHDAILILLGELNLNSKSLDSASYDLLEKSICSYIKFLYSEIINEKKKKILSKTQKKE
ncbi:helix-turn-helix transcriptional regulator [Clostridium sp.]|uniref:helix-turn-helix domain-containing protein n=1 Tax=Clostridium TaxID=1485 RepID=UPI002902AA78|nr:helix-turn-helix transcriptional regulator [Clostridium sp.]MDU1825427.1 helix-turn-helix transcriptional regulator [Clostridium sp.]MDU1843349.1 helix-turn-helix transcriptional regulator [Clostridium sp.]MDU2692198.1 helix-turn-helix transcriptional regulator [Clostridium sp.]MDU2958448.1 helix-turn-helix transcriptional regulator [Clostridium sp.]MDU3109229.1 helix-turn-helix transcriptional regulator [Clostridium sp.]